MITVRRLTIDDLTILKTLIQKLGWPVSSHHLILYVVLKDNARIGWIPVKFLSEQNYHFQDFGLMNNPVEIMRTIP